MTRRLNSSSLQAAQAAVAVALEWATGGWRLTTVACAATLAVAATRFRGARATAALILLSVAALTIATSPAGWIRLRSAANEHRTAQVTPRRGAGDRRSYP
jgi:hypothetical protein